MASDGQVQGSAVLADQPPIGGGLTAQEVAERVAAGLVNTTGDASSRSWVSIVATNLFTRFNAILGALLGARDICVLAVDPADAPVYLRYRGRVSFYARLGNASRELPVDEVVQFVRTRWVAS